MDPFAAPSAAGSHGSPATLSLSTESDGGAGAVPGSRLGVVTVQHGAASSGSALARPEGRAAVPSSGSALAKDSTGQRNDEPAVGVTRTVSIATTPQVLAKQVVSSPLRGPPLQGTPTHMNRYEKDNLLRPKSTTASPRWRSAVGTTSPASSERSLPPALPTNLAQLRAQSSGSAPEGPPSPAIPKGTASEGPPSLAGPSFAHARPEMMLSSQQVCAQLPDLPGSIAEKIAAVKRKVEETVGGASRGETVDFLNMKLAAPPTPANERPVWARPVAEEPKTDHTPAPKMKSPRVELPNGLPATLVPKAGADIGPERADIGPAPLEDLGSVTHAAATSTKRLLDSEGSAPAVSGASRSSAGSALTGAGSSAGSALTGAEAVQKVRLQTSPTQEQRLVRFEEQVQKLQAENVPSPAAHSSGRAACEG